MEKVMCYLLTILTLFGCVGPILCDTVTCGKGHHVAVPENRNEPCVPCEPNTFMDKDIHQYITCYRCRVKEYFVRYERVVKPCTADSDTVIECVAGYYKMWDGQCEICSDCQHEQYKYEARACSQEWDTVCCPYPGMSVDDNGKCVQGLPNSTDSKTTKSASTTRNPPTTKNSATSTSRAVSMATLFLNATFPATTSSSTSRPQLSPATNYTAHDSSMSSTGTVIAVVVPVLMVSLIIIAVVICLKRCPGVKARLQALICRRGRKPGEAKKAEENMPMNNDAGVGDSGV